MCSIKKAITEPEPISRNSEIDQDEDRLFCLSFVGQLKGLEPRFESMAKLQMLKIFNDICIEQMKASQVQQHSQQFSGPAGPVQFPPYQPNLQAIQPNSPGIQPNTRPLQPNSVPFVQRQGSQYMANLYQGTHTQHNQNFKGSHVSSQPRAQHQEVPSQPSSTLNGSDPRAFENLSYTTLTPVHS